LLQRSSIQLDLVAPVERQHTGEEHREPDDTWRASRPTEASGPRAKPNKTRIVTASTVTELNPAFDRRSVFKSFHAIARARRHSPRQLICRLRRVK
jgi:hypothetical protein